MLKGVSHGASGCGPTPLKGAQSDCTPDSRSVESSLSDVNLQSLWHEEEAQGVVTSAGTRSPQAAPASAAWSPADSARLYNLAGWGCGYVSVSQTGTLCVHPLGEDGPSVDVHELVESLGLRGLQTPLILRFPEIACHRIGQLQSAFREAISRWGYSNAFHGVFPVKANQDADLVRAVAAHGARTGYGLEVGSRAELALVLGVLPPSAARGFVVVCNGPKDAGYAGLACRARAAGVEVVLVLEHARELPLCLEASARAGVPPALGLRARLSAAHGGHWGGTSGDKAKFGLRAASVLSVLRELERRGQRDALQLLHFHVGSQIADLAFVRAALEEAAALYAAVRASPAGRGLNALDVGGGLGVDYDGSRSARSESSVPYDLRQYAAAVVGALRDGFDALGVPHPVLLCESGRAVASHHTLVVFDVLGEARAGEDEEEEEEEGEEGERRGEDAARAPGCSPPRAREGLGDSCFDAREEAGEEPASAPALLPARLADASESCFTQAMDTAGVGALAGGEEEVQSELQAARDASLESARVDSRGGADLAHRASRLVDSSSCLADQSSCLADPETCRLADSEISRLADPGASPLRSPRLPSQPSAASFATLDPARTPLPLMRASASLPAGEPLSSLAVPGQRSLASSPLAWDGADADDSPPTLLQRPVEGRTLSAHESALELPPAKHARQDGGEDVANGLLRGEEDDEASSRAFDPLRRESAGAGLGREPSPAGRAAPRRPDLVAIDSPDPLLALRAVLAAVGGLQAAFDAPPQESGQERGAWPAGAASSSAGDVAGSSASSDRSLSLGLCLPPGDGRPSALSRLPSPALFCRLFDALGAAKARALARFAAGALSLEARARAEALGEAALEALRRLLAPLASAEEDAAACEAAARAWLLEDAGLGAGGAASGLGALSLRGGRRWSPAWPPAPPLPALLDRLQRALASQPRLYHVNMSVFRVAMDAWAIGQVFPVLPVHRLDERPGVAATLADVTCDSDGKLCRFGRAGQEGKGPRELAEEGHRAPRRPAPFLRLHALREGEPYRLALALGGVYQEILGSSHNLFGRMHAVALGAGGPGTWAGLEGGEADAWGRLPGGCRILSIRRGETVAQVLKGVHYSAQDLLSNVHDVAQTQVSEGGLSIGDAEDLVQAYADCLRSYPYLSQGARPQ